MKIKIHHWSFSCQIYQGSPATICTQKTRIWHCYFCFGSSYRCRIWKYFYFSAVFKQRFGRSPSTYLST